MPGVARASEANQVIAIAEPAFSRYYNSRGGLATFGYPVTNAFDFLGFRTQIFQRRVMQVGADGNARLLNLLDGAIMPYTRINGSTFPGEDRALLGQTPSPDDPDYARLILEFVRTNVPNTHEGLPVRFLDTFAETVTCETAFPEGGCEAGLLLLMNLEMWGAPTSAPAFDPNNHDFVYQRFQRGIMHYDRSCDCTNGILLGDYFKGILAGEGLPPDLAEQSRMSRFFGAAHSGLADSSFVGSGIVDVPVAGIPGVTPLPGTIAPGGPTPVSGVPPSPGQGAPLPRDAFGVVMLGAASESDIWHIMGELGMSWWYDYNSPDTGLNPAGLNRVRLLHTGRKLTHLSDAQIAAVARTYPGSAWMIGNEPNVPAQDDTPPAEYADTYYRLWNVIKGADPSAKVVAGSVLNWDNTCTGCQGFTSGRAWVTAFRDAYRGRYGTEPPVDVWGIHAYDIDWQTLPMTRYDRAAADLEAASAYFRSIPAYANTPIWITETGIIWSFPGVETTQEGGQTVVRPTGSYQTQAVDAWVAGFTAWVRDNGSRLGIQRMFLYASKPPAEPYAPVSGGVSLFDAPGVGARLTSSGEAFRNNAGR